MSRVDGRPAWTPLSLGILTERVAARAAWLHERGVRPRDPVAVYVTASADVLLSYLALTWLGAIPALMNGALPAPIAAGFIERLRAAAVLVDAEHLEALAATDRGLAGLGAPVLGDVRESGTGDPARPRPTTATIPTTRWPSHIHRARPGSRRPWCTPTAACSRRSALSG
jgi:acyl-CoA synthetase (AMP-forming)/AMP-acid ligase II